MTIPRAARVAVALPFLFACLAMADDRTFLALGDSYTIGEGVDPAGRWTHRLARLLRERGVAIGDPRTVARTGWTCDELSAAMDGQSFEARYDLVTLLVGVNDEFRGFDAGAFRDDMVAMLRRAIGLAGGEAGHVVVLTIPDWGVTPFAERVAREPSAIADGIERFNRVVREEVARAGARLVDVTPASRLAADDRTLLGPDGLHPSGRMYAAWAEAALPEAAAALEAGR